MARFNFFSARAIFVTIERNFWEKIGAKMFARKFRALALSIPQTLPKAVFWFVTIIPIILILDLISFFYAVIEETLSTTMSLKNYPHGVVGNDNVSSWATT